MATYKGYFILAIAFFILTKAQIRGYDIDDDDDDDEDDDDLGSAPTDKTALNSSDSSALGGMKSFQDNVKADATPVAKAEKENKVEKKVELEKAAPTTPQPALPKPEEKKEAEASKPITPEPEDKKTEKALEEPAKGQENAVSTDKAASTDKAVSADKADSTDKAASKDDADYSKLKLDDKVDVEKLLSSNVFFTTPSDPAFELRYKIYVMTTVDKIYSNDPKKMTQVLQFAEKGDLDHSILVYKALGDILTNKKDKDEDVTGKLEFVKAIDSRIILNAQTKLYQKSEGLIIKKGILKVIKNLQVDLLKNTIQKTKSLRDDASSRNLRDITTYSRSLSHKIMKKVISDLYAGFDRQALLDAIATQKFTVPAIQSMKVYLDLLEDSKDSDKYYLPFARYLASKEKSPFFHVIPKDTKALYNYMKDSLPYSVRNVVYAPSRLCFRNSETYDYLYAANVSGPYLNPHKLSLFATKPAPVEGVWGVEKNGKYYNIVNLFFSRYLSAAKNLSDVTPDKIQNPKFEVLMHIFNIKDADLYDFVVKGDTVLLKNVGLNEYLTLSSIYTKNIKRVVADKSAEPKGKSAPTQDKSAPAEDKSAQVQDKSAQYATLWVAEDCSHVTYPFKNMKLHHKDYMQVTNYE